MALLAPGISGEVGLRLLLSPLGSNIVIRTACCTVGVALPVYSTFKAIERKDQNEQEKWLLYWAAYGSFSLVELLSDKILSWFPLYYHAKFAFLVWLQLPSNNGARHLYARHLRPFLLKHQATLDKLLSSASCEIVKLIDNHQEEILFLRSMVGKCAATAHRMLMDIVQPAPPAAQNSIQRHPNGSIVQEIEDTDVTHES
uniref:HVA22-like protein n=1 Tax=Anthurium amnicola TaxID=1678845 RepID=A0A1D1XZQ5_9ARAE